MPHQIKCSPESTVQITTEVQELLAKGAIVKTQLTQQNYVSQIFLVEKKDGGQRPVINLKGLNQFVKTEHFKMEGLHLLPDLMQSQDWMVLDEGCTSRSLPSKPPAPSTFQWERRLTCSNATLGLSTAPECLQNCWANGGLPEAEQCRLIIYIDDMLLLHQDRTNTTGDPTICQLFRAWE